jgi:hypothetical protein
VRSVYVAIRLRAMASNMLLRKLMNSSAAAIDGARVVPEAGDDLVAGERCKGEGLDKPGGLGSGCISG